MGGGGLAIHSFIALVVLISFILITLLRMHLHQCEAADNAPLMRNFLNSIDFKEFILMWLFFFVCFFLRGQFFLPNRLYHLKCIQGIWQYFNIHGIQKYTHTDAFQTTCPNTFCICLLFHFYLIFIWFSHTCDFYFSFFLLSHR